MARKMSLPHERRKATLRARKLQLGVRIAESREALKSINNELQALSPKRASVDPLTKLRRV